MTNNTLKANQQCEPPFHEEVEVDRDLIGYIIGTDGSNINKAKKVPGIKDIRLNKEKGTFKMYGQSKQAFHLAKENTDDWQKYCYIPERLAGHIIDKNGNGVKNIIEASGVIKIIFDARGAEIPQVVEMVTVVCFGTEALALIKEKISYLFKYTCSAKRCFHQNKIQYLNPQHVKLATLTPKNWVRKSA